MQKLNKRVRFLAEVAVFFLLILIGLWLWQGVYLAQQTIFKSHEFLINKGEGFLGIAKRLESSKLIKSRLFFEIYGLTTGKYRKIQPGKYELSPSFSVSETLDKMARGEFIKEKIRILEGSTIKDIMAQLKEGELMAADDFATTVTKDFSDRFQFLNDKPKGQGLEGYIFPDTYEIRYDDSAEEVILKALGNFDRKFTQELRQKIDSQQKTYFEIITMASILEKEALLYPDKQIVAGILWKRIEQDWPLQVDATLTYVTGRYSMELTLKDLATSSPYNTYKHKGLPEGPICNPGIDSIKAAIDYKKTPYWYYMSKPDGKMVFSKTLAEHNLNKETYWRSHLENHE
jgi:UPF0755 protein